MNHKMVKRMHKNNYKDLDKNIEPNREEILEALNSDNYDKITTMTHWVIYNDNIFIIYLYCVKKNDEELLTKLMEKHKDYDFSVSLGRCVGVITNCNNNIIDIVFQNINNIKNDYPFDLMFNRAIISNNIYLANKLQNLGYELTKDNLGTALLYGPNDYVDSIMHLYDNLQEIFEHEIHDYELIELLSVDKIKYIIKIGVDINKHLNNMISACIDFKSNNDVVLYLHELGATNINECLQLSFNNNNIFLMKHFLDYGATMDITNKMTIGIQNYESIKLLLDYEYVFNNNIIEYIFEMMLKYETIDNIEKTFQQFENINLNFILEKEKNNEGSILEDIIGKHNIDCVKFIIKHLHDSLNINKLFIIACCNGSIDIVKMFLDINNNVDYDLGFECALYFCHYDMALYLCQYDVNFNDDMIWMYIHGYNKNDKGYLKILEKCKIINHCILCENNETKLLDLLIELGMKVSLEMFGEINLLQLSIPLVYHMMDNNISANDILQVCITTLKKYKIYDINIPKNVGVIMEYLLNNGAKINITTETDKNIIEFMDKYKGNCL